MLFVMVTDRDYIKFLYVFIFISFVSSIFFITYIESSFAQRDNDEEDDKNDDKLIVQARIHLENIDLEKTKFIRVIGFINGEESKQDIPISSIDKTKNNLNVELKVNKENDIVKADTPDEFFVCAYQVGDISKQSTPITKFDCNESDIVSTSKSTVINLFSAGSQVYSKSQAVYQASLNTNSSSNNSDQVKIKVYAPLADKKDTKKLKLAVMIKGQIQSEVIEDVQAELDKSKDSTIKRTFTFDRDTDIGKIQIGDRFHACVASNDLSPPEGQECEKRLVKSFDEVNSLPAR
jgi:hypothetical protein